jgi:hypothetical protein
MKHHRMILPSQMPDPILSGTGGFLIVLELAGEPYLIFDDDDSLDMDEAANSSFFRMGLTEDAPPLAWRYATREEADTWRSNRQHHIDRGEFDPLNDWYCHNLMERTEQ